MIWRTPNEALPIGRTSPNGQFLARWGPPGPPDFTGVLPGGRAVTFDAKESNLRPSWSFSLLQRHQAMDLEAWHLAGGLAFLALRTTQGPFVALWEVFGPRWWAWNDGEKVEASVDRSSPLVRPFEGADWLSVIP